MRTLYSATRNPRWAFTLLGVVLLVIVGGVLYWTLGDRQSAEGAREKRIALARELMQESLDQQMRDPELGVLLAREAEALWLSPRTEESLRQALRASNLRDVVLPEPAPVVDARFSSDGRLVLTVDGLGTARVWRVGFDGALVATGRTVEDVAAAAFSPDSTMLAVAGTEGELLVVDAESGETLAEWSVRAEPAAALAFGEGGTRLVEVSAAAPGGAYRVRVWDLDPPGDSPRATFNVLHFSDEVQPLLSPDGEWLVTVNRVGSLEVRSTGTGEIFTTFHTSEGLSFAAFGPSGRFVAAGYEDGRAQVWDVHLGFISLTQAAPGNERVTRALFSPDSRVLLTLGESGSARVWDALSGEEMPLPRPGEGVQSAAFSADGTQIIAGREDGTAHVVEIETGAELAVLRGHAGPVTLAALGPGGRWALTVGEDGTARTWWAGGPDILSELEGPTGRLHSTAFSLDGKWVLTGNGREVWVWEVGTGEIVARLAEMDEELEQAVVSPDGNWLAAFGAGGTVWVFNTGTWEEAGRWKAHSGPVRAAAFDRRSTRLATVGSDRTLKVWSMPGEELAGSAAGFQDELRAVQFSFDGERLLLLAGRTAQVWDAEELEILLTMGEGDEGLWSLAWSLDGTKAIAAVEEGPARVWDAETGRLLGGLEGFPSPAEIASAAMSNDGKWAGVLLEGGRVQIWDTESGTRLYELEVEGYRPRQVALSPNDRDIAVAGEGVVRIYTCDVCVGIKELRLLAGRRVTRELTCEERVTYLHEETTCPTPTPPGAAAR